MPSSEIHLSHDATFSAKRPAPQPSLGLPARREAEPAYEGGKLVGWYGWTWNREGTAQVRVWIPRR